jgi:hypothetical protein
MSSYYCLGLLFKKIGEEAFCLEAKGMGGRERGWGAARRNGPNNVCTYE